MAPTLPPVMKSQGSEKLLQVPHVKSSSSRSSSLSRCSSTSTIKKGTGARPEWVGPLDYASSEASTRAPSRASSQASSSARLRVPSGASSRTASRGPSEANSRASSRASSPSSSSAPSEESGNTVSRAPSVASLQASSHASSPSSSSSAPQVRTLRRTSSAKRKLIQAQGAAAALLAQSSSGKPEKKVDMEETQRQLEKACYTANVESAKICRLRGASLTAELPNGDCPLHYAVKKQHFAFIEFLKQYGVDINTRDREGRTVLHVAAANNDDEAICRLCELGADRNLKDRNGRTALHAAAAAGHLQVIELLLELGGSITAVDKGGWTAVALAEFNNHFECADRLVQLGGSDPLFVHEKQGEAHEQQTHHGLEDDLASSLDTAPHPTDFGDKSWNLLDSEMAKLRAKGNSKHGWSISAPQHETGSNEKVVNRTH
eukprot:gnl/MRDRNA2_/MRDRNA2_94597_c0_seq1.p1 gnl/MRDRNA2_/MRDRNA2_94597_c0~~gnl/MRDRNA2_/MRDRNA2_94597_c0_seq1.p1  ORF type:complete len:433 (+),score=85.61 gnl/MRDRNA2_/MRDRNA2_94597_c0_seq1:87-1385(+)